MLTNKLKRQASRMRYLSQSLDRVQIPASVHLAWYSDRKASVVEMLNRLIEDYEKKITLMENPR
jgi:hypothetical protein